MRLKLTTLVAVLAISSPAIAADAPKVDFTTPVVIDGHPLIDNNKCPVVPPATEPSCQTPFTIGELVYLALERPIQNQNWQDGIRRDDLARHLRNAKDWTLLQDQKKMIEDAMGPLWSPAIIGFVASVIEPEAAK